MEKNVTETIKGVLPAIVAIVISKSLENVEKEIPAEMIPLLPFGLPELKKNLKQHADIHGMIQVGGGSGFIVDSNGLILTNKHVIADKKSEYAVVTADGKKYKAEVTALDPINDVAILKIQANGLPTINLGDSSHLDLGQTVYAIGNALGIFQNTVSRGIVSGLSRAVAAQADMNSPIQELRGLIQTDAAINPGNSGGPLIDENGKVVAINAAVVFGAQNIGFAIPINSAKRDLDDVKKYGKVKRPLLGLLYINIDKNFQEKMKLPVDHGALVAGAKDPKVQGVVPNTPAEKFGIKEGDVITECNGECLTPQKTIQDFLENMAPGDILSLKVLRGKKQLEIKVVLAEKK